MATKFSELLTAKGPEGQALLDSLDAAAEALTGGAPEEAPLPPGMGAGVPPMGGAPSGPGPLGAAMANKFGGM